MGSCTPRWDPHSQFGGCGDLRSLHRQCRCRSPAGTVPGACAALASGHRGRARAPHPRNRPAPHLPPSPAGWPIQTPTCGSPGARCTAFPWSTPLPMTGSGSTTSRVAPRTSWWSPSPNPVSVPTATRCGGAWWASVLYGWDLLPGGLQDIRGCQDRAMWDFPSPPCCLVEVRGAVGAEHLNTALSAPLVGCFPQAPPGSVRSWT